ncbi:MAG TPA: SUMF1/EgtB/PvdO family nonheme iron enzyme, partial [Lacipirellulaceae bacterium]|nr:SUMF1/EgtB/PvdO family nonheme iron enzyme [Lacipirellulaceae bacterium]
MTVSAFSILATEVTWSQFALVKRWGEKHGYSFEEGIGETSHPAQNVTWFDAVKWCNALSEMTGRVPAYYVDEEHRQVYRQGRIDLVNSHVKWHADGYRLPTEAEWEYAYRAGSSSSFYWGQFPRESEINRQYAAFHFWGTDEIDGGPIPVASKQPNAFGLYDMAGNVEEWVWDRYAIDYAGVDHVDPRGPDAGPWRVLRGGGFVIDRLFSADSRHPSYPFFVNCDIGFRLASSHSPKSTLTLDDLIHVDEAAGDLFAADAQNGRLDVRLDTDVAACERLMPLLDLAHPTLEAVRAAYDRGKHTDALLALRDVYASRLRQISLESWRSDGVDQHTANRWLAVYRENRPMNWAGVHGDIRSPVGFLADAQLARMFARTRDREYADAYLWMVNEASLYAKPTWDRLPKKAKGSGGNPPDNFYAFIGFKACEVMSAFTGLAGMLQHGLPDEAIHPRILANALYSAVVDRLAAGLQDDRGAVPNQTWANAVAIVEFSRLFPELKDSSLLLAEGIARLVRAKNTVMQDGTDLEASLNYNKLLLVHAERINDLLADCEECGEWLRELNRLADYRRYMFASLASPFGTFPAVGNQHSTDLHSRMLLKEWLADEKLAGLEQPMRTLLTSAARAGQVPKPPFTSIALPFGGYYVQRSGWTSNDHYLFMRSSRAGVGHNRFDNNSVQVAAYGAWLLMDSGPPAYGPTFLPPHQKKYIHYFGERSLGSVFQTNSVAINDLAQADSSEHPPSPNSGWREPRPLLLHLSEDFDLVEGYLDGWYESEAPISDRELDKLVSDHGTEEIAEIAAYNVRLKSQKRQRLRAQHRRWVVSNKQDGFWILVDLVEGGDSL